jgi:hypothetical protein
LRNRNHAIARESLLAVHNDSLIQVFSSRLRDLSSLTQVRQAIVSFA